MGLLNPRLLCSHVRHFSVRASYFALTHPLAYDYTKNIREEWTSQRRSHWELFCALAFRKFWKRSLTMR